MNLVFQKEAWATMRAAQVCSLGLRFRFDSPSPSRSDRASETARIAFRCAAGGESDMMLRRTRGLVADAAGATGTAASAATLQFLLGLEGFLGGRFAR